MKNIIQNYLQSKMYLINDLAYNIKEILDFSKKTGYYICQNCKKNKKNVFLQKICYYQFGIRRMKNETIKSGCQQF